MILCLSAAVIKPAFTQQNVLSDFQKLDQPESLLNGKLPGSISAHPVWIAKIDSEPLPYKGKFLVLNPYQDIEWKTIKHYKTNLHTHTTNSDGVFHPHQVVDLYHNAGYSILSITDHNKITYPWTAFSNINPVYENRDPGALGMLAVAGNELSAAHHTGSYLNVVPGDGANLAEAFNTMTQIDGLGAFKHPGRYWNILTNYAPGELYSIDWYHNYYMKYPALVGMEVFNMADRYPNDRVLWDELLTRMMPARPVWGHSNDDMHGVNKRFLNYNYILMPELSPDAFRTAMKSGASFFAHEPGGNGQSKLPLIDSIIADDQGRKIIVYARDYTSIEWIGGVEGTDADRKSRTIANGSVFDYDYIETSYARAVVYNNNGMVFTQPFGFDYQKPEPIGPIVVDGSGCSDYFIISVDEDSGAGAYNWILPEKVNIVQKQSANTIVVSNAFYEDFFEVKVYKTNENGSSDTASVIITVNRAPETPVIRLVGNMLVSNAETGNQWYNQYGAIQGASGHKLTVSAAGQYYVIVTQSGCSSESSNIITIDHDELQSSGKNELVKIYPNPFKDVITLESKSDAKWIEFEMVNILGHVLFKGAFTDMISIRTDHMPSGIYFLNFKNNGSLNTRKIIKK